MSISVPRHFSFVRVTDRFFVFPSSALRVAIDISKFTDIHTLMRKGRFSLGFARRSAVFYSRKSSILSGNITKIGGGARGCSVAVLGGLSSTHGVIGFRLRRKEGLASWTRAATICARFGLTFRGGETNATARSGCLRQ